MNNSIHKIIKHVFISIFVVIIIGSCTKLENPLKGFKLFINYDIFDTFISLRFIDTATGEIIDSQDVIAEIAGTNKDAVVDQLGNNKERYTTDFGLMSLALNPKAPYIPSNDNPINFSIRVFSSDYEDNLRDITINEIGTHYINIYLEKTSALKQGVKKYVRSIPLHNSTLIDTFRLKSTGNEFEISIPKGVKLYSEDYTEIVDSTATIELIVYNNIGRAPIPYSLVTDVNIDDSITKKAFDQIRVVSIRILTPTQNVSLTDENGIKLKFGINPNFINPVTGTLFSSNLILPVCSYENQWKQESLEVINENQDSLFVNYNTSHPLIFGIGILQPVCNASGQVQFSFDNTFPIQPIPTRLLFYRKIDNRFIKNIEYKLTSTDLTHNFNAFVPEDTPLQLRVRQKSAANGFAATPAEIPVNSICNQNNIFDVALSSTSIIFSTKVTFNFTEAFPNDRFSINVGIYDASNDQRLLSKTYSISDGETVQINTGIPDNKQIYLKYWASNQDNAFTSDPDRIYIDDPLVNDQLWSASITPLNCIVSGNIILNYEGVFENSPIELKFLFRDRQSKAILKEKVITFLQNTNSIAFSTILPKEEQIDIRILRTGSGQTVQIYPYLFDIDNKCNNDINISTNITPAISKFILYHVTVECPSAEILPTLQGFYRTVWDNDWQNAEIVDGFIELFLEQNGTYEVGIIIDEELKIQEHKVTENENDIRYILEEEDCDKMGW